MSSLNINVKPAKKSGSGSGSGDGYGYGYGSGLNDDARMQNYWIGVENCVDAKICELERA